MVACARQWSSESFQSDDNLEDSLLHKTKGSRNAKRYQAFWDALDETPFIFWGVRILGPQLVALWVGLGSMALLEEV